MRSLLLTPPIVVLLSLPGVVRDGAWSMAVCKRDVSRPFVITSRGRAQTGEAVNVTTSGDMQ